MVNKGLMITNAALEAEKSPEMFAFALAALESYDLQLIEFYTPERKNACEYGKAIKDRGYKAIFHSALDQKRSGWCRLCSEDEVLRKKSVEFSKKSIEKGICAQAFRVVMQSGTTPERPEMEGDCLYALARSMEELDDFVGSDAELSIEPCDRSIDVRQLIGPSAEALTFMEKLNRKNVSLTMDTAHIALTFENPVIAIELCKPWSNHIHAANCYIDRKHPLFGDKHPLFGDEGGRFSDAEAQAMYARLLELYGDEELYISTEMIGREPDQKAYIQKMLDSMPWFFTRK